MTNFEKIKNMTIEQMADVFDAVTEACAEQSRRKCFSCPVFKSTGTGYCDRENLLHWLANEVIENDKP